MLNNLDPRMGGFFLLTGASFAVFASGFSVCLFNLDTVQQCADLSNMWLDKFIAFGNHIITWFFALFSAVMARQGA